MKAQITNNKSQTNPKHQAPNHKRLEFEILNLEIVWKLRFEIWKFALPIIFLFTLAPFSVSGQIIPTYSLYLDKPTIAKGYTVAAPSQDLWLGILPNTVSRPVTVEFYNESGNVLLPKDKDLITSIYRYAVVPVTDNTLETPINLKFSYPKDETRWREIYILDENTGRWQNLPGSIDVGQGVLMSATRQATGVVAVFADHLDKSEYVKAAVNAPTVLVTDAKTGEILIERQSSARRPIASLTKLMTASVFLDNNPGWDARITMLDEDDAIGAKLYVKTGDILTAKDLFYTTLVRSANNAANALARATGLSRAEFVRQMNEKAKALGMENTLFTEPTGLSEYNVSTAEDYLKLSRHVLTDPVFLQATTAKTYTATTVNNGKKYPLANTNKTLAESPFIITGAKTGFTYEAGRCLMTRAKNKAGREVIAIILGADKPGAQWTDIGVLLDAALN